MAESTLEIVQQIIVDRFGVDEEKVTPSLEVQRDLGADSLDVVELVMELEDTFSIQIEDDDVENIRTVQNIVDYLDAHK